MDKEKVKLGIAPIGWTNDDLPDLGGDIPFEQCIREMKLAGFSGTEVGNKFPKDPKVLKRILDEHSLQICNQWFSGFLTVKPYEEVEHDFITRLDFLQEMGASVIGVAEQGHSIQGMQDVPIASAKPVFTDVEWKRLTEGLNRLGAIANKRGFQLCYHHHMGTGCQTLEEVDRLLEMTEEGLVWLLYDSGHFAFSHEDPVQALNKYVKRVAHVHLKDVRPRVLKEVERRQMSFLDAVRAGVFTIPGDGMIDFPAIFSILTEHDYCGWMVVEAEQDPAKANPLIYAQKARAYIREQTGL